MSGSKQSNASKKTESKADQIKKLEKEIVLECKKLATFKVSSAVHINEKTKELLRLEMGEQE